MGIKMRVHTSANGVCKQQCGVRDSWGQAVGEDWGGQSYYLGLLQELTVCTAWRESKSTSPRTLH